MDEKKMKKILPVRFGIIQKVILVLTFFAMSVIWPLRAFSVSQVSTCEWDGMRMSGVSNETDYVRQEFSPNFEQLKSVSVYVTNNPDSFDTLNAVLRIYDYTGVCLSENFFQLEDYEVPGYVTIPVDLKLSPGILYFYTIGGVDGDLMVAFCGDADKTAENGAFYYKEVPSGGTSIVTQYTYDRPMGLKRILLCDAMILFAAGVFIVFVGLARRRVFQKCRQEQAAALWKRAEGIVRYSVAGVAAAGVIVSFVGIVLKRLFTDDPLNILVLFAGTVVAAGYVIYGVLTEKSELEPLSDGEYSLEEKGIHFLRAFAFAVTIIMCCMYINGYTDFEKGLYMRRILVAFGIFMVSLGKRGWIFNIPNAVWTVAAIGIGKYYVSLHNDHIEHIQTATGSAWVIWAAGLVLLQILYRIIRGEWKKIRDLSLPCVILIMIFWIGCAIFANGRSWPLLLCVVMSVWFFIYTTSDKRSQILEDLCNGVLLAFAGAVVFCLYRRPYQYFMLTRYGGIFFTATSTAIFYLVPAAAALTKIVTAVREKAKRKLCFSCCFFGMIAAYMGFTASRTGIFAMFIMVVFAFLVPWNERGRSVWKKLKVMGILVISTMITFIMTFSMTRMFPAMAGTPFYFGYEQPYAYITENTPWRGGEELSETYVDIQRTMYMLLGRMFTVDAEIKDVKENREGIQFGKLYASTEPVGNFEVTENVSAYANGRLEIFQVYLENMNLCGHDTMVPVVNGGEGLIHAHNSFIQVAFDFGIPMGILFLFLCFVYFIRSIRLTFSGKTVSMCVFMPLFIMVGFCAASMVEWVYHLANPLGFMFLTMLAPLTIKIFKNSSALESLR